MFGFFKDKAKNGLSIGQIYRHIDGNEKYQILDFSATANGLCYVQNIETLEIGRCLASSLDNGYFKKGDLVARDYLKSSPIYTVSRIDGNKVFCSHDSNTEEYCFYSHDLRKATKKDVNLLDCVPSGATHYRESSNGKIVYAKDIFKEEYEMGLSETIHVMLFLSSGWESLCLLGSEVENLKPINQ